MSSDRRLLIQTFHQDRPKAHAVLFAHRHPQASPPFHEEMIRDWHGPAKGVIDLVFRGGAKSTISEEAVVLMGCFRKFRNCLIVGENYDRAAARLHAVKHEIETNDSLRRLFGDLRGTTWGEDMITLSHGAAIVALGKGQSLRGIKHEDMRPDLVFGDDLENRQDVATPENRKKTIDWFTLDLLPACDPAFKVRVDATPLHPESLAMTLANDPSWITHKYPFYYLDDQGQKQSSWPERFPIEEVLRIEASYQARGQVQGFRQEYMCESEAPETKAFKTDMFRIEPTVRSWQPVYTMTDPARTIGPNAATTGKAIWSWIGAKLVIWDSWARQLMPDEIVADLYTTDEEYRPVWHGFEEDGLNQWALQPIRQAGVRRGVVLPLRPVKAPNSKIEFIRGLQPFFQAREVVFTRDCPDLKQQLLGFPAGRIDAPNALAYALRMRPGAPIYDDFRGSTHVAEDIRPLQGSPAWLCLNATRSHVTGMVVQVLEGSVRIFADFIREGEPGEVVADIVAAARLEAGRDLRLIGGPLHFDPYNNVGLRQAIARIPASLQGAVEPSRGQPLIRDMLQRERRGMPSLMVSSTAAWTLRAFSGGYSRALLKQGMLADYAEDGPYRTLMEGLESFAGLLELGSLDGEGHARLNAETAQGRGYRSMLAGNSPMRERKSDWNSVLRGQ